jgi:hypothetical protein
MDTESFPRGKLSKPKDHSTASSTSTSLRASSSSSSSSSANAASVVIDDAKDKLFHKDSDEHTQIKRKGTDTKKDSTKGSHASHGKSGSKKPSKASSSSSSSLLIDSEGEHAVKKAEELTTKVGIINYGIERYRDQN